MRKAVIMDTCKNFFTYTVSTRCGFPSITLEGTVEDWVGVREHCATLIDQCCMPEFAASWKDALLPGNLIYNCSAANMRSEKKNSSGSVC